MDLHPAAAKARPVLEVRALIVGEEPMVLDEAPLFYIRYNRRAGAAGASKLLPRPCLAECLRPQQTEHPVLLAFFGVAAEVHVRRLDQLVHEAIVRDDDAALTPAHTRPVCPSAGDVPLVAVDLTEDRIARQALAMRLPLDKVSRAGDASCAPIRPVVAPVKCDVVEAFIV